MPIFDSVVDLAVSVCVLAAVSVCVLAAGPVEKEFIKWTGYGNAIGLLQSKKGMLEGLQS